MKKSEQHVTESVYEYQVYGDRFHLNIYKGNEKKRFHVYAFSDIQQMQDAGNYLLLWITGQIFILRKSALKRNSAFFARLHVLTEKARRKVPAGKWKAVSLVLFIGSLVSFPTGAVLWSVLNSINHRYMANMWIFFLLIPLPVASFVFGYVLKSKGFRYRKNVIAGIIMTVLLYMFGFLAFI